MITKRCPHCHRVLPNNKLFGLDPYVPSLCDDCGGWIKSTPLRFLLAGFLPCVIAISLVVLVPLFRRYPEFMVVLGFLLWPFSEAMLANPVKAEVIANPCLQCKRIDVGFPTPWSNICDDCLTKEERKHKTPTR